MPDLSPRVMNLTVHTIWVRDLRHVTDPAQRDAFLRSLAMHYGQAAADRIRAAVEQGVAA